ncbi:MAG: bifunctional folylpolyglutamate synthase/dihydrofolate synthase [Planctomycetaceae bacterium]|jgi:dihydrofolate synthase / folylpolyglutamate synthase|nr:bifunctional folylpolyglutamate synthase/dihydrofolate synthase [Planctomycetaceae bacterium]MBT6155931.1 bifunctional folylpolyglutamate synthase/dihydrofolate synthase [Planctomycetaceae bacterium]MBT6483154.1 bifunctional folylpolyglutamate synthase/dihydrofolate synthase [Planctomycetaceae bacterium]MBT6497756.1 bifunctional folylpolyglutamate synthase/dihydrofolate synthase [Planctomycetaceae bacterium]
MPRPIQTRGQALSFLFSRIDYERTAHSRAAASCFKLDRMQQLLERLDDPQLQLPAVHIAGTKGKGSTAVMVSEMLSAAGFRTGLFTSPHIHDFEERMRVDGATPSEQELVEVTNRILEVVAAMDQLPEGMQPTYFEIVTAMAWLFFSLRQVDVVVLEVGLGGRLDATNLCSPLVTVITNISLDHTAVLGTTLASIAGEKAGIVKPNVPVVSGVVAPEARAVVHEVCRTHDVPLYELGRDIELRGRKIPSGEMSAGETETVLRRGQRLEIQTPWRTWSGVDLPLAGEHQAQNAAIALAVIDLLDERGRSVSMDAARNGLTRISWPLRIEVLRDHPTVLVDAAHNVASATALIQTLEAEFPAERSVLVFAATRDKDFGGMLEQLHHRFETIILTAYTNNPRGVPVEQLATIVRERCSRNALLAADPQTAWDMALSSASANDLICITGSFFLAAEMRETIRKEEAPATVTP